MFKKHKNIKENNPLDEIELVLLKTINNNYELGLIKSILEENQIPYIVKDRGTGGYMRIISGDSLYETEILVDKLVLDKANSILDEFIWDDQIIDTEN